MCVCVRLEREALQLLLATNVSANAVDQKGKTAAAIAAEINRLKLAQLLEHAAALQVLPSVDFKELKLQKVHDC